MLFMTSKISLNFLHSTTDEKRKCGYHKHIVNYISLTIDNINTYSVIMEMFV